MPIGVQLVGRRGNDARLLRTASWLVKTLESGGRRRAHRCHRRHEAQCATRQEEDCLMTNLMTGIIGIAGVMRRFSASCCGGSRPCR